MAPRVQVAKCTVCGDPAYAKGLCQMHYHRARRNGGDPGEKESRLQSRRQLKVFVAAPMDSWLRKRAKRDRVSVSRLCETLIERGKATLR